MSCYEGRTIRRRMKVRRSIPPLTDEMAHCITPLLIRLVPFLPVREDFHPKRNQARQKLATLPASRFKDLSSDVFYELSRRYPEFKEQVGSLFSAPTALFSHTTPRLASKTDRWMSTHRRSTPVHQILPQCHR